MVGFGRLLNTSGDCCYFDFIVNKGILPVKAKERLHLSKVALIGCIACRKIGHYDTPAEIHHVKKGTERRNHFKVIPLCPKHHRFDKNAIHQSKVNFQTDFGTEEELLKEVNEMTGNA